MVPYRNDDVVLTPLEAVGEMEHRVHDLVDGPGAVDDRRAGAPVRRLQLPVPLQNSLEVGRVLAKRVARSRRQPMPNGCVVHDKAADSVERVPDFALVGDGTEEQGHPRR